MSTLMDKTHRKVVVGHKISKPSKRNLQDLSKEELEILEKLRSINNDAAKIEIELHRSIFVIEQSADDQYLAIFENRKQLLKMFHAREGPSALKGFWLGVLKAAGVEFNTLDDEKIMSHLIDVRSRMFVQPNVRMVIEFEFEKNKYFSNDILTKTYYVKCRAEPNDTVIYDGIEITNMEGCRIDWLIEREKSPSDDSKYYTFFDFYGDRSESAYANRGVLDEEIAFGFFLREKVIPKAVFFFTGELAAEMGESEYESDNESDRQSIATEEDINENVDGKEEDRDESNARKCEEDSKCASYKEQNVEDSPLLIEEKHTEEALT